MNQLSSAQRNAIYAEAQNAERIRRKNEGLLFISQHKLTGHFETQQEFRDWFCETFKSVRGLDLPMWVSGRHHNGVQSHEWLLATPEQMMLAKLVWS